MAGEVSSSSQAPAPSSPPPSPQADRASGARQAPPETISKQKVKWSWASYTGGSFGVVVRLFSWDGNDTSRVKGDDNEEPAETDRQRDARVDEQAHLTELQDDLLRCDNDVVREQVGAAADSFMENTLKMVEENERELMESVLGKPATFGASSIKSGNDGLAEAAADFQAGRAVAAAQGAVAAEQEGLPSKADEQCSDDDFQETTRVSTKGAPASDAQAPSSKASHSNRWALTSWLLSTML